MHWWEFALLGAGGGVVVEVLVIWGLMTQWQTDRRTPKGRARRRVPHLGEYLDLSAHVWILVVRAILGAGVATFFGATGGISGVFAAVALGYAAPAVLTQLGGISQVNAVGVGGTPVPRAMGMPSLASGPDPESGADVEAVDGHC